MFFILLIHVRATPRVGGSCFCNLFVVFTVDRQQFWWGVKIRLFYCEDTTFTELYGILAFGISEHLSSVIVAKNNDQSFSLKGLLFEFPGCPYTEVTFLVK